MVGKVLDLCIKVVLKWVELVSVTLLSFDLSYGFKEQIINDDT